VRIDIHYHILEVLLTVFQVMTKLKKVFESTSFRDAPMIAGNSHSVYHVICTYLYQRNIVDVICYSGGLPRRLRNLHADWS
jgi:hypothetical protein